MAGLSLRHISKIYPNGVKAVDDFNMEIEDKEFIVFVGPSGCGKSTTLRMIAGLEEISDGELYIGDKLVNDVEPKNRDIAMVFQNYALYPHMTVFENMAFGLKLRKTNVEARDESTIIVKGKNGKKLNPIALFFTKLFCRVPLEARDENHNIIYDENGAPVYEIKKKRIKAKYKKGEERKPDTFIELHDKEGNPIYAKRPYTIEEYAGKVITDENGNVVYVAKKDKNGEAKKNKQGEIVYKLRKFTKLEIDEKVKKAAAILGLTPYLQRKPAAMSGGQRQRVALGRAIVRNPKVFLLDEPLSNLDAKLRTSMRSEISKLHNKLQTTFIYVTHDQVEAMTMGTRIVVMKNGVVQQIDTPRNLYDHPVNKFVAGFIGTPQMNFFKGTIAKDGGNYVLKLNDTGITFNVAEKYLKNIKEGYVDGEKEVYFGIRSEHISVDPDKYLLKAKCTVQYYEDLGIDTQVYADFNANSNDTVMECATRGIIKAPAASKYELGKPIDVSLDVDKLYIFDAETEQSVLA